MGESMLEIELFSKWKQQRSSFSFSALPLLIWHQYLFVVKFIEMLSIIWLNDYLFVRVSNHTLYDFMIQSCKTTTKYSFICIKTCSLIPCFLQNEHDKIRELTHQLALEKKRSANYKKHLELIFEHIEEHNESLSKKIRHIVNSVNDMETKEQQGHR